MNRLQAWFTVNDVTTGSSVAYPELLPLDLGMPPEDAFDLAVAVARGTRGWRIVNESAEELCFAAEASTPFLSFVDDTEVWVESRPEGGSRIHVRSRSRVGRGDFGANARRIRAFLKRVGKQASRSSHVSPPEYSG